MAVIADVAGFRGRARQASEADFYLFILVGMLTAFGLVTIWSAGGASSISPGDAVVRQAAYAIVGMIAMGVVASINYRFLKSLAIPIYIISNLLLFLVLAVGTETTGSVRWIYIGPISFQPSDVAKLGLIIALAAFLSSRHETMDRWYNFIISGLIAVIPFGLVFIEPDLGTALVFLFVWIIMLALSRTRMLYVLGFILAMIPIGFLAWEFVLQDYQRNRLLVSFDPYRDYFGTGFNIVQAQVTIGSAGWFGHGLDGGLQTEFEFLRVDTTDFIFAHAMSMFGFVGGIALFVVFLMLFYRMTRAISESRDAFGQYLATGLTAMLAFPTFVNIGMNVGLMPVTGIPLPFISLGGTSLVTNLIAIGIIQSILIHRRALAFQPRALGRRRT